MLRVLHSSLSPLTCSQAPLIHSSPLQSPPSAPFPSSNRKPPQANITHLERQQIKMAEHQNIPGSANHRISGTTILYVRHALRPRHWCSITRYDGLHSLSLPNSPPCSLPSSTTLQPGNSPSGLRGCRFDGRLQPRRGHGLWESQPRCCHAGSPLCPKGRACGEAISWMMETLTESRQRVKEEWVDHGGCMHHTVEVLDPSENENVVNRE